MADFLFLFECVGKAAAKNAGRALARLVPFGEYAFDIALDTYAEYTQGRNEAQLRAELERLAQAPPAEVRQVADKVAQQEAANQPPEVRQALADYLAQMPCAARQSLRRPADPRGTTIPPSLSLKKAVDLLPFLPTGLPRFQSGDRPLAADWELVELLGKGGFGEVWKARHLTRSSVKPVALKFCLDPEAAHSLRNEASLHDVLDRLRQQNSRLGVVPLLETYLRADPPCLMYELIEGGDLAGLVHEMHEQGSMNAIFATRLVQRLASIVAAAHRLEPPLVHRDLKMSNVLVRRMEGGKFSLLVADYGIGGLAAGQALREQAEQRTVGSKTLPAVRGSYTPLYASPQQVAGGAPDPRDDVHALGVIWYQLLTGDLAMMAVPPDWRDEAETRGLDEAGLKLLGACLSHRADRRPKDAGELADRLAAVSPGKQDTLAPQSPPRGPTRVRKDHLTNSLGTGMVRIVAAQQELYVGVTCVSNNDYREFVRAGGRPPRVHPKYPHQRTWDDRNNFPDGLLHHPVVYVAHADAVAFCAWLTQRERESGLISGTEAYRLPTLAQWRDFARHTRVSDWTVLGREWISGQHQPTEPVDHEAPNNYGLRGLLGNVFEWCADSDRREVVVPAKGGGKQQQVIERFAAIGGGWASTREWLQTEVDRGSFGTIMCPQGWMMRDGGFRLCLITE